MKILYTGISICCQNITYIMSFIWIYQYNFGWLSIFFYNNLIFRYTEKCLFVTDFFTIHQNTKKVIFNVLGLRPFIFHWVIAILYSIFIVYYENFNTSYLDSILLFGWIKRGMETNVFHIFVGYCSAYHISHMCTWLMQPVFRLHFYMLDVVWRGSWSLGSKHD